MSTLFISDLHLEDKQPRTCRWLLDFLAGAARKSEAVYILGDLFEYWIGDDALSVTAQRVAEAITELVSSGVNCFFMHGNRDFLLGKRYAALAGMELLPDPLLVDLYGTPTLLLHGDSLCTDDIEYQAFRQQSRNPEWQARILAMTIEERLQLAGAARDASKKHTGTVSMEIMDVNETAVRDSFLQHGVRRMIHGHTHRPACHKYQLEDSSEAERIVLADWYSEGSYLRVDANGVESVKLACASH